ncbi:MAG TPA: ABC transporter permease subunit, partial [Gemmataceae bacterium]|nr:ABC transporter permease subunit [Gemmataceae bacterium]
MTIRALALFLLAIPTAAAFAQPRPLRWGADADGGIPYVFADPNDPEKRIGFEKDIADALARELGRPIEFEQRKFENLLPDLDRGDIDLVMNGFEILPERIGKCLFTKPYYVYQLQYVVPRTSPIQTVEEIKAKNILVGTLSGSSAERYLNSEKIESKGYEDQDGPYKDLRAGVVGAVLLDLPITLYYAAPDTKLEYGQHTVDLRYLGNPFAEGYYAIAVRKDAVELQKQLDAALDRVRDSGELKRILKKWELWNADQYRLANPDTIEAATTSMSFLKYFPLLLAGAVETVKISVVSMALAVLLGLPISLCRLYGPAPLRWLAIGYIEFFRGIPVLLLLFFIYYG